MSKVIAASHALGAGDGGRHQGEAGKAAGKEQKVDPHGRAPVWDGPKLGTTRVKPRLRKGRWA